MDVDLLRTAERIADGQAPDFRPTPGASPAAESPDLSIELGIIASIAREYRRLNDAAASTTTTDWTSRRWGHLDVLEEVGRGGYGTVYRAHDRQLDREVALKLYRDGAETTRVIEEGRRLAKVRHPNVVTVFGADVVDGSAGIWMEFIRGRSLGDVVKADGPMSAAEATSIGLELARALAAVHKAGLIHRDVKAQNIMCEEGGRIVLMDLGASASSAIRSDAPPDVVGTPGYMAPELFDLAPASRQSDIYSLGVLLFHLVTGELPIEATTLDELRQAHRSGRSRSLRELRPDLPRGFVAIVTRMLAPAPGDRFATTGDVETALGSLTTPRRSRPEIVTWLAALAAALIAAIIGYDALARNRTVTAGGARTVVAVLPMQNLTGDASMNYLGDALTQVLIADLASLPSILVPSYDAVARFRDPAQPAAEIAGQLHANLLLTGSITGGGDRLRMTVSLVDPSTGSLIWGEHFTRDRKDTLATQAEVARLVAAKLELRLGDTQERALTPPPISAAAQDAYLRGLVEAAAPGDDRQRAALAYLEEGVRLEPNFAAAWAHLALVQLRIANTSSFATRDAAIDRVREAALNAIRLNPAEAEGHGALALLQFYYDWDFKAAESSFLRALELNRSAAVIRQRYSTFLASQRRLDEALAQAAAARVLEPTVPQRIVFHAFIFYYRRDYQRALEEMRVALANDSGYPVAHYGIGRIASAMGDQARAIEEINAALAGARNSSWLFELARVYTVAGRRDDAARILAEIEGRRATDNVGSSADSQAYLLAASGRLDEAFEAFDDAVNRRVEGILWIQVDPRVDPIRGDPRYEQLLRRIGF